MSTITYLENITYITIFICLFLSLIIAAVILGISFAIAIQRPYIEKTAAYECGFSPFEDARTRFDVRFYIVAILFLIFDIEVAFIFPWASTLGITGYTGYMTMILFLFLLTIGFFYEVAKGALNIQ